MQLEINFWKKATNPKNNFNLAMLVGLSKLK